MKPSKIEKYIKTKILSVVMEKVSSKNQSLEEDTKMAKRGRPKGSKNKKSTKKVDKYIVKKRAEDENKILCNKLFTRLASQNVGKALILDAEDLRTTFWLHRRGFKNITVPNPFVYDKIKDDSRITPVNKFVGQFISHTKNKYTAIWLDYCATFDGNQDIQPQDDIKDLFKKKLLKDNSTLAVTFTHRKPTEVKYVGETEDRVRQCIHNEARLNGYNIVPHRTKKYKGMLYILFKVFI